MITFFVICALLFLGAAIMFIEEWATDQCIDPFSLAVMAGSATPWMLLLIFT